MTLQALPYNFKAYPYQMDLFKAFFKDGYKRLVCIWHRRAGKDKVSLNLLVGASQQRVGVYYYVFPELKQARRDIWENIDRDGMRFLDHIPKSIVKKYNNSEMVVELNNGSLIRLVGSDRYDSLMGSNPVGIIFAEYSLQKPQAWDYLRPILAENKGWALFQYTPRGMNHGYGLYSHVKDNKDWYVSLLTVEQTKTLTNEAVISQELVQAEKKAGMSDELALQEFYCSFTSAVRGAYFANALRKAYDDNRIFIFGIDVQVPVETYWDLGHNDMTAIWLVQRTQGFIKCIYYYENNNQPISFYINWLDRFRADKQIVYSGHYAPHDGAHKSIGTGKSVQDLARELGFHFHIIPRCPYKIDAIEAARSIFGRIYIHETNCQRGLACLREYHSEYNEKNQVFADRPVHNWSSHGADAFMAIAQQFRTENPKQDGPVISGINRGRL